MITVNIKSRTINSLTDRIVGCYSLKILESHLHILDLLFHNLFASGVGKQFMENYWLHQFCDQPKTILKPSIWAVEA